MNDYNDDDHYSNNNNKILLIGFDISKWQPSDKEWIEMNEFINDPIESKRISNFKRPNGNGTWLIGKDNSSAKSSIIGRRLIIELVKSMLSINDYNLIKFKRTDSNKPYLSSPSPSLPFSFNISHDSNLVIAIGSIYSNSIGIDIMNSKIPRNQKINEFFGNMKSCFTDNEWNIINKGKDEQSKIDLFFIHWCLKESFIKADGKGLGIELKSFEFKLDQINQTAKISFLDKIKTTNNNNNNNNNNNYQFTYIKPSENNSYIIAICLSDINSDKNIITKDNISIKMLDPNFKIN